MFRLSRPIAAYSLAFAVFALWVLALPIGASAQPQPDLYHCLYPGGPNCMDVGGSLEIGYCSPGARVFQRYYGRVGLYPLRYVGPITVAVETYSPINTRFPLYVEIVPLPRGAADYPYVCENLPGNVVLIIPGHFDDQCGTWEEVGPIDLAKLVPLDSLYAIRLYLFGQPGGYSPAVDCVRVTAHPEAVSPVDRLTWGHVKALYK